MLGAFYIVIKEANIVIRLFSGNYGKMNVSELLNYNR